MRLRLCVRFFMAEDGLLSQLKRFDDSFRLHDYFFDRLAVRYANRLAFSPRKRHSRRLPGAFQAPSVCWRLAGEHVSNALRCPSRPPPQRSLVLAGERLYGDRIHSFRASSRLKPFKSSEFEGIDFVRTDGANRAAFDCHQLVFVPFVDRRQSKGTNGSGR
jgi:hypothetical protein